MMVTVTVLHDDAIESVQHIYGVYFIKAYCIVGGKLLSFMLLDRLENN